MKPHKSKRFLRQEGNNHTKTKGTLAGLVHPEREHSANFTRILPGQMDKLVEQGLFERLPHDELGRPQYRITGKGRQFLKEHESK